ncbi:MAG: hypothetical protein ACE15C_05950 [Phycisphaerae bacterium]
MAAATLIASVATMNGPAAKPARAQDLNLDKPEDKPTSKPAGLTGPDTITSPDNSRPRREDALPGVVELSNGRLMAGWLFTTAEKPWIVYVESEQRWRMIPFITVLSITAEVVEEKMEQEWRWKEMGVPEKVFTGREYPTRRMLWRFHLIDDSTITGAIKGQPLWIERDGRRVGPMALTERSKGEVGQKLADFTYIKRIIISPRAMDQVLKEQPATLPASNPAP